MYSKEERLKAVELLIIYQNIRIYLQIVHLLEEL